MSSKKGTGAKNSSASEPQTLSLRMSSSGGGGGSSGVATASANVADPSEIHLEEGIVQHQQLQDSDLSSTGHGGGVNKIHPASYRPASLTVNASSNSRNVSIIINPMEATTTSAPNGNSGNSNGGGGGSGGAPSGVTHMNGSTNPSASASSDRYQPGSIDAIDDCGSPGTGTESPGTSQMSPPPSYHDIPGTVPVHQGVSRGPPPSYEDAVDPNAPPPSYDSLFGRIRDTHKTSRNFIDFLFKVLILLLGTIGCTIACSITIVIPVCMIVIGAIYFNECPAEPYIPVFLIVGGSFSVFKYLIGVITRVGRSDDENSDQNSHGHSAQSLISCFLCGWFITGCVWVYRIYKPLMDEQYCNEPNYCNKTVYIFAFWLITTAYIFLGLFTSCICCISIVSVILKREY